MTILELGKLVLVLLTFVGGDWRNVLTRKQFHPDIINKINTFVYRLH